MSASPGTAPTLTDGVVTLRAHRPDDVQGAFEQATDPLSQRWTSVPVPYSLADAVAFVTVVMPGGWSQDKEWGFAVEHEGRYAGTISLRNEDAGRAEVAYGSHPRIRGRGVMERALRLLLEWGFAERQLHTVIWWANRGNWASRKLAWRLGFSVDGTVRAWLDHRGELTDAWVGTLLRDDPRRPRTVWLDCPRLEGNGIVLRPHTEDDLVRIAESAGDPETQHWLAFVPRGFTLDHARDYLDAGLERLATGEGVHWALSTAEDPRMLARIGLFRLVPGREAEVGYWVHPDARGRGLAKAGARLAIRHAFETLGLERVTAYASAPNLPSRRVLEAIGMRQTGIQRRAARTGDGAVVDLVGYDLLAEEYDAGR